MLFKCFHKVLLIRIYNLYLQRHKKLTSDMDIVHTYAAVVKGYHYYKQFWKPVENEELRCLHEKISFYDSFAVKTVHKNDEIVGYLPR